MRPTTLFLVLSAAFLPASLGDHCESYRTSEPDSSTDNPTGMATYYVDLDGFFNTHLWSIWVYEESNGLPGLQRGDELVDDTCHSSIRSDTIIF